MGKRFNFELDRRGVILALVGCALVAAVVLKRPPILTRPLDEGSAVNEQPYGTRSGVELHKSWEADQRRASAKYSDSDLQSMVEKLFEVPDPHRNNYYGLLFAEPRSIPLLVKALDDPRTSTVVFYR